jgi:hypothetical protein
MSDKTAKTTPDTSLTTLKIGSRVRCTDDGVEGRITWANGVSVKIVWTDGEKVTWRRDSLAARPIEIFDAADAEDQPITPAASAVPEPAATTEMPASDSAVIASTSELAADIGVSTAAERPTPEPTPFAEEEAPATPLASNNSAPTPPAKPKRQRKDPASRRRRRSALWTLPLRSWPNPASP